MTRTGLRTPSPWPTRRPPSSRPSLALASRQRSGRFVCRSPRAFDHAGSERRPLHILCSNCYTKCVMMPHTQQLEVRRPPRVAALGTRSPFAPQSLQRPSLLRSLGQSGSLAPPAMAARTVQTGGEKGAWSCQQHSPDAKPALLRRWLAAERQTWLAAVSLDPFLPEALLPADYLGRQAWAKRETTFAELRRRQPG